MSPKNSPSTRDDLLESLGRLARDRFDGAVPSDVHVEQGEAILRAVKAQSPIAKHAMRHLSAITTLARLAALAGLVADRADRKGDPDT